MSDWLDKLTTVHRLPGIEVEAKPVLEADPPKQYKKPKPKTYVQPEPKGPMPMESSMYILKYGKKGFRAWEAAGSPRAPDNTPLPPPT